MSHFQFSSLRTSRLFAIAALIVSASAAQANDAFKSQTIQRAPAAQSVATTPSSPVMSSTQPPKETHQIPQPSNAQRTQSTTLNPQPLPPVPTQIQKPVIPSTVMKAPPLAATESAKLAAPALAARSAMISGLGDDARGIVAGESLVIRGNGFGDQSGRVEIAVQLSAAESKTLTFQVTRWSDSEVQGRVGASLGVSDLKAAITLYPGGRSVADAISSDLGPSGTRRTPWRFRFTATRVEQTISAASINPQVLTSNYASPAPQLLTQGNKLLNGWAVSRRQHSPMKDAEFGGCDGMAVPQDKFQLKLANGFELIEVKVRDLNRPRFDGPMPPSKQACDHRYTMNAPTPPVRSGRDGSFVIQSTWDIVARYGANTKSMKCSSSRPINATKTPLGFDWDNFSTDRCGFNAEYAVDAFVVRGPAGLNPFFGTPDGGAPIK
jgi:hypothetical protein